MERRYSLNGTQFANPIAESTCLNGTSTGQNFPWGATGISPKNRNNSISLDKSLTNLNRSKAHQTISPMHAKIDPRIYADVQSRGLASRIVKYHEDGQRLNRSMSVNNIYSKPGQFPIVHLNANKELPYKATKQNVSMTRIAPPKESMFCGNTLSSLLRSSSIVGLQKTNDELSHENRPILHPPPTETDLAPTRSVIEVLKEISRKRINSDDNGKNDTNKKYCNREHTDNVDSPQTVDYFNAPTSYKRQRDQLNSPKRALNRGTNSVDHGSSPLQQQQQNSPEQTAKKRQCSYNNDISSSLSSSMKSSTNKRKYNDQTNASKSPTISPTATSNGTSDIPAVQKSKMLRYQQSDLHFENISKSLSCNIPITPIPNTPFNQTTIQSVEKDFQAIATNIATAAQRTVSAPVYSTIANITNKTNKPKLTLFNTKCDEEEPHEDENEVVVNDDEAAGIQFVKPKKAQGHISTKNPLIERTKQSKLAALLAGLRGEIYEGLDEIDAKARQTNKNSTIAFTTTTNTTTTTMLATGMGVASNSKNNNTSTALTMSTNTTNATTTTTSIIGIDRTRSKVVNETKLASATVNPIQEFNVMKSINSVISTNVTSVTTTTSAITSNITPSLPLGGFQLNSSPSVGATISPNLATTPNNVPTGGGFQFNQTSNINQLGSPPNTKATPMKTKSPLVGLKLTPQTTSPAQSTNTAAVHTFGTNSLQNNATPNLMPATIPVLGGFVFSAPSAASTFASTVTTPSTQLPSGPASSNSTNTISFDTSTNTTTTCAKLPKFDGKNTTFSFGSNSNIATNSGATATTTVTPTFGSIAAASTVTNTNETFTTTTSAFSGITVPQTTATPTKTKTPPPNYGSPTAFGAPNNIFAGATLPGVSFTFGNTSATVSETKNSSSVTTTPSTNFVTFGANNDANKPLAATGPFSFNNNSTTTTTSTTMTSIPKPTTTSSTFSFGGNSIATSGTPSDKVAAPKPFSFTANTTINTATFGSGTNGTQAPNSTTFGSVTNSGNSNNIFGGSIVKSDTANKTNASVFAFGGNNNDQVAAKPTNAVFPDNSQQPNFAFGSTNNNATTKTNSIFGSASANSNTNTGTANTTFTFGSATNAAPAGATNQEAAKPSLFAFGSAANQAPANNANNFGPSPATNNIFGTPTTTNGFNTTTGTAAVQQSFSFSTSNNNNNPATSSNTFGAVAATTNNNKTFSFGSSNGINNDNNNATAKQNSFFGGGANANTANKPFAFGGSAPTPNPVNPFGKPTANQQHTQAPAPTFAFGNTNANTTNNNPSTFSFGGNNNNNNPSTAISAAATRAKPFSFGAAATPPQNGPTPTNANIFGTSGGSNLGANTTIHSVGHPYQPAGASASAPANGNIFALPTANQGERMIRRATRRLHK